MSQLLGSARKKADFVSYRLGKDLPVIPPRLGLLLPQLAAQPGSLLTPPPRSNQLLALRPAHFVAASTLNPQKAPELEVD